MGAPEHTVLLIDDDRDTRESVAAYLGAIGFAVETAADGRAALARLRAGPAPCLILLDLTMPGMDGWTFREHQLADPAICGIPVVVFSATSQLDDRARRLGLTDVITKPGDPAHLEAAVAARCPRRH